MIVREIDIMQVTDLKPLYGEDKLDALQLNVARFNAGNQNGQPKRRGRKWKIFGKRRLPTF